MTQKGEAGRALGAMLMAASMGAILGVLLALAMIPAIRPVVMSIGKPELCLIILLGLSFLAVLGRESPVKGLISGFVGIFISLVGFQESTGVARLTFGSSALFNRLDLIPVTMGLFAGAELLELGAAGESIAPTERARPGKELRAQIHRGMKTSSPTSASGQKHHDWLYYRVHPGYRRSGRHICRIRLGQAEFQAPGEIRNGLRGGCHRA